MRNEIFKTDLKTATSMIQETLTSTKCDIGMPANEIKKTLKMAERRSPGYDVKVMEMIKAVMNNYGIYVVGMEPDTAAYEIYKYIWGMDPIEELYMSPSVDELRINSPDKIYYMDRGRNMKSEVSFKDDEHVKKIIDRMLDINKSVDESNPGIICDTMDGARITVLGKPLTPGPVLIARKHGTFDISEENYINSGTMDGYIQKLLSTLIKGRSNIIVCGDSKIGKTTLVRWLVKYLNPMLRIVTVELNPELNLNNWYPDRDILSVVAHPELGWSMKKCFQTMLVASPDVIIVGEARGEGEASQTINACRSGHHGSMTTLHVFTAQEAVTTLALMAMEEGRRIPLNLLEDQVASAFDVIVQMYGNSITGTKKIERIVEVWKGKNGPEFSELCKWIPSENSFEKGCWDYPNGISERLASKLFRFGVKKEEIEAISQPQPNYIQIEKKIC